MMKLIEEVLVPAGHGRAFRVPRGALLEIVDVEGQQVADFISIREDTRTEWLSATHTRSTTGCNPKQLSPVSHRLETGVNNSSSSQ